MRYQFVHDHRREFPVEVACRVLDVSRGGYYDWAARAAAPPSDRRARAAALAARVRDAFDASGGVYGSPRVHAELKDAGVRCCENTVAKVMRATGLRSAVAKRFKPRTTDGAHQLPVAENVLARQFDQPAPDRAWCADVTCVATGEGWVYLAVVIDLCSRMAVGWAAAEHMRADLCLEALSNAAAARRPTAGLIHHSDRGSQYASADYRHLLGKHDMICSMSRRGNCWDNAVAESFFKSLKAEWVYRRNYATRADARRSLFEYVEVFYNRRRRHSALGHVSPTAFEAARN